MGQFTWLLTVPGEFIVDLLFSQTYFEGGTRGDAAVTAGIVFWIVLLLCLRLAWPRLLPILKRAGREGARAGQEGARTVRRRVRWIAARWSWPDALAVFWRAESVHLALYVLVPGLAETMRAVMIIVLLPFTLMGVGEKRDLYEGTFDHLHHPVCWTFVSWCPSPSADFLGLSRDQRSACQSSGKCPAPVLYRDRYGIVWKTVWTLFALAWIATWHERRHRRRPRASRPS